MSTVFCFTLAPWATRASTAGWLPWEASRILCVVRSTPSWSIEVAGLAGTRGR